MDRRTGRRAGWTAVVGAITVVVLAAGSAWAAPTAFGAAGAEPVVSTGTVVGAVTTTGTGDAVPGAWVALLRTRDLSLVSEVVADAGGSFSAEVEPGRYFLYLIDPSGRHATGFSGTPDQVSVTAGAVTAVAPTMALTTGSVTGIVTDALTHSPVAGAWAIALNGTNGMPEVGVMADSSGRYSLPELRTGRHRIVYLDPTATHSTVFSGGSPDAAGATPIDVTAGATTAADVAMPRQSAPLAFASLRGTVTEAGTTRALGGVLVIALRTTNYSLAGAAVTASNGRYRVNLQPGGSYKVAFIDTAGAHDMEWHQDRPYDAMASAASVTAPSTANAALDPDTGSLGGTVVDDETGAPIAGAWVLAIGATGSVRGAVTDAVGAYEVTGLPVGTYRAAVIDTVGHRALEYWNDSPDYLGADSFTITPSAEAAVDAGLSEPGPTPLLDDAVGWWNASSGLLADGSLPDLTGRGNDLTLHPGTDPATGPALVAPDPTRGRNLFSPGWDDMYLDTPDPETPVTAVDLAWEGDLGRVLTIDPGEQVNWLAHQGSTDDGTFSWAVGIVVATGQVTVARSTDGTTISSVTTAAAFPAGNQRGAVTVDPDTGDLTVYRQDFNAPVDDFDLPYTDPSWVVVDSVAGTGPLALLDSAAPIRHSSSMAPDRIDGDRAEGWFRALYRMRARDHVQGAAVAYFDVDRIADVPAWYVESGLPPVGGVEDAKATDITGRAGETWTIHDYMTTSYPIVVVDHPSLVFGNGSYAEAPVDDESFDLADGTDLSVWIVYAAPRVGGHSAASALVAFKDQGWASPGWRISGATSYTDGPRGTVADGTSAATNDAPAITEGATSISGFQLDRTPAEPGTPEDALTDTLRSYTDGVTMGYPTPTDALGSLSNPGAHLRVASYSDDGHATASFAFIGLAVFHRILTEDEIARLPAEFGLIVDAKP